MTATVSEILEFIKLNDVKFIRLAFCDLLGRQKNISIMPDELERAFCEGVSFDASAIRGFSSVVNSDLLLIPDPSTLAVLPWRPQQGRVVRFYCDIISPDGSAFPCDPRGILKKTISRLGTRGFSCKVGAECEFYLFKTDENGNPTRVPLDYGGYFDVNPLDKGENVRREICLTLEDMGLKIESSHHEQGPGQNEIDFKFADALESADNLLTFKTTVKAVSAQNGLYACFLPKPLPDRSGNGLHINISLYQNGKNLFEDDSPIAKSFIAGILDKAAEMSAFLNPLSNSYERLGVFEAPKYVSWSHQNRSQLIRIPAAQGEKSRMELRSPDPSANPYLAYALIIGAGLSGIEKNLKLPDAVDDNLYNDNINEKYGLKVLPVSLDDAIQLAERSEFVKDCVGDAAFHKYVSLLRAENDEFVAAPDKNKYFTERFFPVI